MIRRCLLAAGAFSAAAAGAASATQPMPLGYNTYCLRSLQWNDARLLQFAADRQLDAIFL